MVIIAEPAALDELMAIAVMTLALSNGTHGTSFRVALANTSIAGKKFQTYNKLKRN